MDGTLLLDKPEGLTSHDVVRRVRKLAGMRQVGHAGTLDPFATGLLIVCIGRATRLVQYLVGLDKEYLATVRLGFATDTQDHTGSPITPCVPTNALAREEVEAALSTFVGKQMQVPPMFSAKRIGGERLYKAAREGREVERQPVPVTVHSLELLEDRLSESGLRQFRIRVHCSSGTYIRTLAHDLGKKLGIGAHLSELRRTSVGRLVLAEAMTLSEAEGRAREGRLIDSLLSLSDTLAHLPAIVLDATQAARTVHGQELRLSPDERKKLEGERLARMCASDGLLIAVGENDLATGVVRPRVVLAGP